MSLSENESDMLRDRWFEARKYRKEPLPLILHEPIYKHFGEQCKIVEANVYDTIENAEVVVESWNGDRATVEFSKLSVWPNREIVDAMSRKPLIEIIRDGVDN